MRVIAILNLIFIQNTHYLYLLGHGAAIIRKYEQIAMFPFGKKKRTRNYLTFFDHVFKLLT